LKQQPDHRPEYPSARKIRRSCQTELYRTIKKMKVWVDPDKVEKANQFYYQKVVQNSVWIHENRANRKKQVEWWESHCCDEMASILEVNREALAIAFRASYIG